MAVAVEVEKVVHRALPEAKLAAVRWPAAGDQDAVLAVVAVVVAADSIPMRASRRWIKMATERLAKMKPKAG